MNEKLQRAVFIDRDGTLVEEVNFLSRPEDLKIFPFAKKALGLLRQAGYLVFVVTNQSGIGRGFFSEDDMHAVHRQIALELPEMIDSFCFCPHIPGSGCICRKPMTGMIQQVVEKWPVDLAGSWMIGDKQLDIETGMNAGVRTALVMTGYGSLTIEDTGTVPDIVGRDLLEAVEFILRQPVDRRSP